MTVDVRICPKCKLPQDPASPDGMQLQTTCVHCDHKYYGYDTARWPVFPPRCPFCDDVKTPNLVKGQDYVCNKCNGRISVGYNYRMYRYISPGGLLIAVPILGFAVPATVYNELLKGAWLSATGICLGVLLSVWIASRNNAKHI